MARNNSPKLKVRFRNGETKSMILPILTMILLFISILILDACSPFSAGATPGQIPASSQHIPIYPNASGIHEDYTSTKNLKQVSFQTSDKLQAVQDYYKGILIKEGWEIDPIRVPENSESLTFSYTNPSPTTSFTFDLVITSLDAGELSVVIRVVAYTSL